jgi:hypothetical protein
MPRRSALVGISLLALACAPAAVPVPTAAPRPSATSMNAPIAEPTVLWTSPPAPRAAPSPSASPPPDAAVPAATLAPSAAPPPPPRPTPSPDPFRWTGYSVNGSAIYVPAAWTVVDPSALRGIAIFAASPEAAKPSIVGYRTLVRLQFVASAAPGVTLDRFGDALRDTISAAPVTRERIAHPSGGAILLKYQTPGPDGAFDQQVEAVLMANGHVYLLSLRSPLDRVAANAPVFNEIVRRFVPA